MSRHVIKECANCGKHFEIDTDLYLLKYKDNKNFITFQYFCCPSCMDKWKRKNKITRIKDSVMQDLHNYLEMQREKELRFLQANRRIILKRKNQAEYDLKRLDIIEKQINEKYDLQK